MGRQKTAGEDFFPPFFCLCRRITICLQFLPFSLKMGEIYYNQGRMPFELYAPEAEKAAFSLLPGEGLL